MSEDSNAVSPTWIMHNHCKLSLSKNLNSYELELQQDDPYIPFNAIQDYKKKCKFTKNLTMVCS